MLWRRYLRERRWVIVFVTLGSMIMLGSRIGAGAIAIYSFTYLAANVTAQTIRTLATVVTLMITLGIAVDSSGRAPERWTLSWFLTPLDFWRLMFERDAFHSMSAPSAGLGIATALVVAGGLLLVTTRWVEGHDF